MRNWEFRVLEGVSLCMLKFSSIGGGEKDCDSGTVVTEEERRMPWGLADNYQNLNWVINFDSTNLKGRIID